MGPKNPFVETALSYALSYISAVKPGLIAPISITIFADDDYYSQSNPNRIKDAFTDFKVPLHEAHKTGLGSSAALVTAFTAALLLFYLPPETFSLLDPSTSQLKAKDVLHNLAQASHCAAQGKVGSGFDVAAAVYGSCNYRRFSPSILDQLGQVGSFGFLQRLQSLVQEEPWDTEIIKLPTIFPTGVRIVMCDVDCGSQTVGMVKKVLAWRQNDADEAERIWTTLQESNKALAFDLIYLAEYAKLNPSAFKQDLESIASGDASIDKKKVWNGHYANIATTIQKIRSAIREMSDKSNVPIEPVEQQRLLDACSALPGVIGGVVPGAGGYDAIVLLVADHELVMKRLEDKLASLGTEGSANSPTRVRILGVKEDKGGIQDESTRDYTLGR